MIGQNLESNKKTTKNRDKNILVIIVLKQNLVTDYINLIIL